MKKKTNSKPVAATPKVDPTPKDAPKEKAAPDHSELIAAKVKAGLSREDAIEVIERQEKEDAASK